MNNVQHIFAATDMSPLAQHAVDRGFQLASATGARYTVMQALGLDALGPLRNLVGDSADDVTQRLVARQHAAIAAMTGDPARHHGVTAHVQVEPGLATRAVPAAALDAEADLVVVGAKGESPLRRYLVGSTASHLLRKSRCPVLVVKRPCKEPYRRAIVPVDFSPGSEVAIRLVGELAPHAQLVLLHVFHVPFEGMLNFAGVSRDLIHRYRADAKARAQDELHAMAERTGLQPERFVALVEHGDAVHHILEREAHAQADLVVMGKHGTHVTEELLLGSVTQRVLAESHSDVLVVVDRRGPSSGAA